MTCAYILECADGTFYVGSTRNIEDRLIRHRRGECRYTKSRLPIRLVFTKEFSSIREARVYEYFIKRQRNKEFYKKLINGPIV